MDLPEPSPVSSLPLFVDPSAAMAAAKRLYAADGSGLYHSGWEGRTVPRRRGVSASVIEHEAGANGCDPEDEDPDLH